MEEEVAQIREDAIERSEAAKEVHMSMSKALEAAARLGEVGKRRAAELLEENAALEERIHAKEDDCASMSERLAESQKEYAAQARNAPRPAARPNLHASPPPSASRTPVPCPHITLARLALLTTPKSTSPHGTRRWWALHRTAPVALFTRTSSVAGQTAAHA